MDKWLKTFQAKKPRIGDENANTNISTTNQQQMHSESIPSTSATIDSKNSTISILQGKTNSDSTHRMNLSKKQRNYQAEYLKYGFTSIMIKNIPRPKCLLCLEILANDSMKPSRLSRHLITKHPEHEKKPVEFFTRCLKSCDVQSNTLRKFTKLNDKCLEASLEVSYLIAKNKKPHTIGETLILPAALKMVEMIHGTEYAEKLKSIPLSAKTVKNRIERIADDLKKQVIEKMLLCGKFAIQLDESTDVSNMSQLLVFTRFVFNTEIFEELLFCEPLKERCTGQDIFLTVNDFFNANNISWKNCLSITSDGAAALTGIKKGFKGKVIEIAPHVIFIHCIIHRQAIAAKKLEPKLHEVFQEVISVVNYIKARPLNSRIFSILCNEMGSTHENLLYYTPVRWLSRGKVLSRVVELKDELRIFFTEKQNFSSKFKDFFYDEKWLSLVCYLGDIFEKINILNLALQNKGNVLTMYAKVIAFRKKLAQWREHFDNGHLEMFPSFCDFITENSINITETKNIIHVHLKNLEAEFFELFKHISNENCQWVLNPFLDTAKIDHRPIILQEQLIEIREDVNLKVAFEEKELHIWWLNLKNEYLDLSNIANDALLPFGPHICVK